MIVKLRTVGDVDLSNYITDENKDSVKDMISKIENMNMWCIVSRKFTYIEFGEYRGTNTSLNIVSQTVVNNREEKKTFTDLFFIIIRHFENNRRAVKESFKNSQREDRWSSESFLHPIIISILYELRRITKPLYND